LALPAAKEVTDWQTFLQEWSREAAERGFQSETILERDGHALPGSSRAAAGKPTVYLSSGVHGDEPAGPHALLALLTEGFFDDRFHWLICPVLNPTGLVQGKRENAEGMDLNRDYKVGRTGEVRAHRSWLQKQKRPDLFLSLHEDWESEGFYYYEINLGVKAPGREEVMKAVSPFFAPEPASVIDDHEVTGPGWIFHSENPDLPEGWPEAIWLAKMGCPLSLTFETPSRAPLETRVRGHQAVVREAVKCLG
jgi:predicted deacylase